MTREPVEATVRRRLEDNVAVAQRLLDRTVVDFVTRLAADVVAAYRAGGKLLLFGNGGSAADAQHLATEFVGHYLIDRPSLPALALADSSAAVTGISNDYSYPDVFARQVQGLGTAGDIAIGLSTSGRSENVLRGLRAARDLGLVSVGLTGEYDAAMAEVCDRWLAVPSRHVARIQEAHMLVGHTLAELVECALYPPR